MEQAVPISLWGMLYCYLLLLIPAGIIWYFNVGLLRRMAIAVVRMTIQLTVVGVVLIYLFRWDNIWLNLAWIISMILFATFSAVNNSDLNIRKFGLPVFLALTISAVSILVFFNGILLQLPNIFTAQYLIIIGGMLLGNALKGIIIGLSSFFKSIVENQNRYQFHLAQGASQREGITPFLVDSLKASLSPSIATMATLGVVFLPGMMTGQIIGGSSPDTAIRYQIAIMIAIFVCITLSVLLGIFFSVGRSFDGYGNLRAGVLK